MARGRKNPGVLFILLFIVAAGFGLFMYGPLDLGDVGIIGRVVDSPSPSSTTLPSSDSIRVASWNIENFGVSKASDPVRMRFIANILKDFDLIAIQEVSNVRELSDPGCPRNEFACPDHANCHLIGNALEQYLNRELGLNYNFVFSPQVRDERYLFVYDPLRVSLIKAELVNDSGDSLPFCSLKPASTGLMVRQPFKARFRAGVFDFVLLTAHTSPSMNVQELEGLEFFFRETEAGDELDVIVLGDLNADCRYLRASDNISFRQPGYFWVVGDDSDTTVSKTDCAYDRFIFKNPTLEDYSGYWGVYTNITDEVSDHYLVWAEFTTTRDTD